MEYGKNEKRVFFRSTDHTYAKFIVKLRVDEIVQKRFLNAVIEAYINDDPNIRKFVENNENIHISVRTKKMRKKEDRRIALEEYKFNLSQDDVDEIFDILEEEED
jgi:hypothetical protein